MKIMLTQLCLAIILFKATILGATESQTVRFEIENTMNAYLVLWNNHDATAISKDFYRLDSNHPWATLAGLQAEFDRLAAQGYDHSDIKSIVGCAISTDEGQAELRYVRLKTDGNFMPPKERASVYHLRRFTDGWKIIGMSAMSPKQLMQCPANSD